MKLWAALSDALDWRETTMRHEFVIGPLCDSALFGRKARLYYCVQCKWSFLVCGSKFAVLDESGSRSNGDESSRRFVTFEKPCPVLEAFASESLAEDSTTSRVFPGNSCTPLESISSRPPMFSDRASPSTLAKGLTEAPLTYPPLMALDTCITLHGTDPR